MMTRPSPQFHVGDRVRLIRPGLDPTGQVATVTQINISGLVPLYVLHFDTGAWMRVPEFDLAPAAPREK